MNLTRLVVLGAGGIGGNLPLSIGMSELNFQNLKDLFIVDDDIMEISNMNRIPVDIDAVNHYKVDVIRKKMANTGINVSTKKERVNNFGDLIQEPTNDFNFEEEPELLKDEVCTALKAEDTYKNPKIRNSLLVIDCRDVLETGVMFEDIDLKLSYNGGNIMCITFNPTEGAWKTLSTATQSGYEVTPSFFIPPAMICEIVAGIIRAFPAKWIAGTDRKTKTTSKCIMNLEELIDGAIITLGE